MTLFLQDEDVNQCVSMDDMLEAIETMQRHHGHGEAANLSRRHVNSKEGILAVMGGGLFYQGLLGVKTYTGVKGTYRFHVSLYDTDTGKLICYAQANRLGQLRTGATSGVAVKYLANPDAATLGIIGTGYQARTQLEAVSKVRQLSMVKVYSRTQVRREEFAGTMASELGIDVVPASRNREVVEESDIVIGIAATLGPVVEGDWLKEGSTVVGAGQTTWRSHEVDEATLLRAGKVFVDSLEQAHEEAGEIASAADLGLLQWNQIWELRHAVAGIVPGRDSREQIVYVKLMGTGVADVAAAKLAYDRAKAAGLGVEMEW